MSTYEVTCLVPATFTVNPVSTPRAATQKALDAARALAKELGCMDKLPVLLSCVEIPDEGVDNVIAP